jgi:hypothetical protein
MRRFKHAKKVVVDEPPISMEALRELLSREIHVCAAVDVFLPVACRTAGIKSSRSSREHALG